MSEVIRARVEAETSRHVPIEVEEIASVASARHPTGSIAAILFYGSCFRDGQVDDGLVDLYLLAHDASAIYSSRWMRFWATLIPPNVYYVETVHAGRTIRAKYALLTLEQFEHKVTAGVRNPYFWARFAQPTGIVSADDRDRIVTSLVTAIGSLAAHAHRLSSHDATDEQFWTAVLSQTYRTELRVEKPYRTKQIHDADAERYRLIRQSSTAMPCSNAPWWLRRIEGRLISVARLIKASFTFTGGPDYIAWKIERHSGVKLDLTPWQKRHPVLAAGPIFWRLWRSKTIR